MSWLSSSMTSIWAISPSLLQSSSTNYSQHWNWFCLAILDTRHQPFPRVASSTLYSSGTPCTWKYFRHLLVHDRRFKPSKEGYFYPRNALFKLFRWDSGPLVGPSCSFVLGIGKLPLWGWLGKVSKPSLPIFRCIDDQSFRCQGVIRIGGL